MLYRYGRGFGFRGSSPPWPYVGRGRGGLPRCRYPGTGREPITAVPYTTPSAKTYEPASSREEEIAAMRDQTDGMKLQLEDILSRIQELEKKE